MTKHGDKIPGVTVEQVREQLAKETQYLTKFGTDTAPQPQMKAVAGVSER